VRKRIREIREEIPRPENPCTALKKARRYGLTKLEIQFLKELCETQEDTTLDFIQFITLERDLEIRERLRKLGFE
jgi:hypothetical protein